MEKRGKGKVTGGKVTNKQTNKQCNDKSRPNHEVGKIHAPPPPPPTPSSSSSTNVVAW